MKHARMSKLAATALASILCLYPGLMFASPHTAEVTINNRPPVALVLLNKLMSGRSKVGDQARFATVAPVYDSDHQLLIPAGCAAFGTVTRSKGSGMFGKRGQLDITCDYVVLPNGAHVPLTGSNLSQAGNNGTGATVAVTLLVSPLGLLIKGGTAVANIGLPVTMYIGDGARIMPTKADAPLLGADFAMRDKHAPDVQGKIVSFDGSTYTVKTDTGVRTISASDIKSIELDFVSPQVADK